jgi:predicted RNA-binding protein with PIN domain
VPYLIDGHNLIGRMKDISLEDPDDELKLVARLQTFCAREATSATVYFDGAVVGAGKTTAKAGVAARFVAPPETADGAIRRHLERLGREARNWVVVSSDSAVAESARRSRARVESSEVFARRLSGPGPASADPDKPLAAPNDDEVAAWEAAFRKRRPPGGKA